MATMSQEPVEIEEEEIIASSTSNEKDAEFDAIVGALEECILDEAFVATLEEFGNKHCHVFEDTETNKIEYTPVYKQYVRF